eukprot:9500567-Pyramimonas_sp.AAC.4
MNMLEIGRRTFKMAWRSVSARLRHPQKIVMLEIGRRTSDMAWRSGSLEKSSQQGIVGKVVLRHEFSNVRLSPEPSAEQ